MVKEVRVRRRITLMAMQDSMYLSGMEENAILSQLTILRAEKGHQDIRVKGFKKLMSTLDMPVDAYFCPCLENQTMELLQHYDALTHYVTYAKEDTLFQQKGEDLLNKLKTDTVFAQGINRQKLISQEVVLLEATHKDPAEIKNLILQGLDITYPELAKDPFSGDMLIFEEGPLLHNLARTYMHEGNTAQSIAILKNIFTGLHLLPQDDREKERMYAPMLLTLVQCYMQDKNYSEALAVCNSGLKISLKRNNGFYAPDFAELKAICLLLLGKKDELPLLILHTLAGYCLLRRYSKADNLLHLAHENKININTHGMETIRQPMPEPIFAYGKNIPCGNIGELIAKLRYEANLTLNTLCEGLCHESTLSKIESNPFPLDKVYLLESLMQRLGRHVNHYFDTFIPREEFENKRMRDEIKALLVSRDYDEAKNLLEVLATKKSFQDGANLQFVELAKATIYGDKNRYTADHITMIQKAIKITRKNFDIGLVARMRLTYHEVTALNQLANSLCGSGNMREGLRLFEDIIDSMNRYYVDEHEKINMFTTVMRNYSTFLGQARRYNDALKNAIAGEDIDVKHGRLRTLPISADNRAVNMLSLGDKENCLPYFAMSYYGSQLVGRQKNAGITHGYVKEHLGVEF